MILFRRGPDPRDAVIELLSKQNADLLDRLQEMIGQIHYHQVEANKAKLEVAERPQDFKLYTSEEEDDAVFLATREDGSIDESVLAKLLADANFANTTIDIEP